MCFVCSKEPSHRDGSFQFMYLQIMFWLRNKENIFKYILLSGGLVHDKTKISAYMSIDGSDHSSRTRSFVVITKIF